MGSLSGGSKSKSKPISAQQLQDYYTTLDSNTGGRLSDFARSGTPELSFGGFGEGSRVPVRSAAPVAQVDPRSAGAVPTATATPAGVTPEAVYNGLSAQELQALGGLGASRELTARRTYDETAAQLAADPRLSVFQGARAAQLSGRDLADALDAIAKESEAAITQAAQFDADRALQASTTNAANALERELFNAGLLTETDLENTRLTAQRQDADADRALSADQLNTETARALSLADLEAASGADALNQEAAIREALANLSVDEFNALLERDDLESLASIFFGGKGQTSSSSSSNGLLDSLSISI